MSFADDIAVEETSLYVDSIGKAIMEALNTALEQVTHEWIEAGGIGLVPDLAPTMTDLYVTKIDVDGQFLAISVGYSNVKDITVVVDHTKYL